MFGLFSKEKKDKEDMAKKTDKERFTSIVDEAPPKELVHPDAAGFIDMATPKPAHDELFIFKCASCGHRHFRHAGYMQTFFPYMRPGGKKEMTLEPRQVMVCVKCKKSYIWISEQMYDVTEHVDLNAWEETEKEAHKATGPGGQC